MARPPLLHSQFFFIFLLYFVRRLLGSQYANNGKETITVRNCLLHNAGIISYLISSQLIPPQLSPRQCGILSFDHLFSTLPSLPSLSPSQAILLIPLRGIGKPLSAVRSHSNITHKKVPLFLSLSLSLSLILLLLCLTLISH
jgi:hypothetical protein